MSDGVAGSMPDKTALALFLKTSGIFKAQPALLYLVSIDYLLDRYRSKLFHPRL